MLTRDEIDDVVRRYGWRDDDERAAALAEVAERQQRLATEDTLAWCKARNTARVEAERRSTEKPTTAKPETAMTGSMTDEWAQWVNGRIKASRKASEAVLTGAIADVLGDFQKQNKVALDDLRTEVAALKREVSELRAEAKVRGSLDDVQARLEKLETPTRLRAAS
jgi:hypothetical protein